MSTLKLPVRGTDFRLFTITTISPKIEVPVEVSGESVELAEVVEAVLAVEMVFEVDPVEADVELVELAVVLAEVFTVLEVEAALAVAIELAPVDPPILASQHVV
jgi:hypothetical protein